MSKEAKPIVFIISISSSVLPCKSSSAEATKYDNLTNAAVGDRQKSILNKHLHVPGTGPNPSGEPRTYLTRKMYPLTRDLTLFAFGVLYLLLLFIPPLLQPWRGGGAGSVPSWRPDVANAGGFAPSRLCRYRRRFYNVNEFPPSPCCPRSGSPVRPHPGVSISVPHLDRLLCGERERLLLLSLSRDRDRSLRLLSLSREVDRERLRSAQRKAVLALVSASLRLSPFATRFSKKIPIDAAAAPKRRPRNNPLPPIPP